MRWTRPDPYGVDLVDDCEAVLVGRYVERCESLDRPVPVWAWMNLLAHGSEGQLRAIVLRSSPSRWRQAESFIAGELIDLVDRGVVDLLQYQREVLIPLELEVMSCATAPTWHPGQLVTGLLSALPPRSRRRAPHASGA